MHMPSTNKETLIETTEPPGHVNPQLSDSNCRVKVTKSGHASKLLINGLIKQLKKGRFGGEH